MLNEDICKKREELNKSILNEQNYDIVYKLSIELDELIAQYYRGEISSKRQSRIKGNKLIIVN